jgi:protein ATS1
VVRELAVGSEHVLALVDGGKVVAFGWGEHGNCGPVADKRGDVKGRYIEIPVPGEEGSEVVGVGAGCATSWVVMS